jgi:NAD(P)H dehydrogenase (quinone)
MIAVTGATGHLGRLVLAGLLEKVAAKDLVAIVRTPSKAAEFASRGVQVREGDYLEPESLKAALAGVEKLLLISSSDFNDRAGQHRAVITAAKTAGVKLIVYTSILRGPDSKLALAADHIATEKALAASGVPYVFLRNGWYFENYTERLAGSLQHGFAGSAGAGRIAAAPRADFAAAAVKVLTTPGHENKAYELAGDQSFSMAELAAEVSKQSGKTLGYADLPADQFKGVLTGAGLPGVVADILVDADVQISKGQLDDQSGTLRALIGRPTGTLATAVKHGLAQLG